MRISQPRFRGELHHVAHLARTFARDRLRSLVGAGQIVVSPDGSRLAHLSTNRLESSTLSIGDQSTLATFVGMRESPAHVAPKLLALDEDVLAFGSLSDGSTGVFRVSVDVVEQRSSAHHLLGVQRTPAGTLVFVRSDEDDAEMIRVISPFFHDELRIHRSSSVTGLADGSLLVLEPLSGPFGSENYRYRLSPLDGFQDMHPVPIAKDQTIVGLVRWYDMYLLGLSGPSGSRLLGLGESSVHLANRQIPVRGTFEHLWQSPTGQSFAWVARIDEGNRRFRQLVVNRRVIYEGDFSISMFDLFWSKSGREAVARVRQGRGPEAVDLLVSSQSRFTIHPGHHVDEVVVDDQGQIAAWIQSNTRFSYPFIGGELRDGVEYAWNLTTDPDGSVVYNSVLSDVVTRITDRTHLT